MTDHLKDLLGRVAAERTSGSPSAGPSRASGDRGSSALASTEREIAGEIAHSLGKAGRLLAEAIAQASATRAQLEGAPPAAGVEREELVERFERERAHAERRLRYLLIQREALGWRNHAELKRDYVIPPPLPRG